MERFVRRIRGRGHGSSREGPARAESVGTTFLPRYLLERREPLSPGRKKSQSEGQESEPASTDFGAVGEQVAAVLASAQQAAEEIRQQAAREAEQVLADADEGSARTRDNAAVVLRDAERERLEAERYGAQTRAAADSYAEEKRRENDSEAERIKAGAEGEGRAIVKAAERRAHEIEQAAHRRSDEIAAESAHVEERLKEFLSTSQALSERLVDVLAAKETELAVTDESLDEVLTKRSAGSPSS
jgi:hypothetical protein